MTTRLVALFVLFLGAAAVQAGGDCYNSEYQWRTTSTEPENLRVTDADVEAVRQSIAAHEATLKAEREAREAASKATAAAPAPKEGG